MATLFSYTKPDGSPATWRDKNRFLWLIGPLNVVIPLATIWLYLQFHNPFIVLIPFLHIFVLIPLLDAMFGEDPFNPPEEIVPAFSDERYYRVIVWLMIVPHYVLFVAAIWFLANNELPLWAAIIFLLGIGSINGNTINLGHELGHKQNKTDRLMAKIALGVTGYGHFSIEHNRGHHVRVSTPEDCSSARMGESVYEFMWRDLPGALIGGWQQEAKRLKNRGLPLLHWENEILHSYAITLALAALLIAWLGWIALPFILIHHFIGWYSLTEVNYIEHYGLLRQKQANGKYEPCAPRHSWNTNHIVSNLMQIHLQRHSDHHANPMRPYQALRNFDDLPRLPSGYPGCLVLAAIPPLWFKVMDPKVMAWADGDLSKVNVSPSARKRLEAKYAA